MKKQKSTMSKHKSTPWMELQGASVISRAAEMMEWSELTIWTLIRLRIVRWGVHLQEIVVSMIEIQKWASENPELSQQLKEVIVFENAMSNYLKSKR